MMMNKLIRGRRHDRCNSIDVVNPNIFDTNLILQNILCEYSFENVCEIELIMLNQIEPDLQ